MNKKYFFIYLQCFYYLGIILAQSQKLMEEKNITEIKKENILESSNDINLYVLFPSSLEKSNKLFIRKYFYIKKIKNLLLISLLIF